LESLQISALLKDFESHRILVIGDVMVDAYLWGVVSRISPEAPVPVVNYLTAEKRPGGAANVALNIHSLGAMPLICSVIGADEDGSALRAMIKELGMPDEGLIVSEKRNTTIKTRIIAGRQQLLRIDREDDRQVDESTESMLLDRIRDLLSSGSINAVVFQDYDKGVITPLIIEKVIAVANAKNIPTLVDPKKRNFAVYRSATLFKPNYKELTDGLGTEIKKNDFPALQKAAKTLQEKAGFRIVLVTLSEEGMLVSADGEYQVVPTQAIDVADVSGAGDTVIAVASLCLASGTDPFSMAKLANLAAGLVCEKIGVVPVKRDWLQNAKISL
jgi:D-glycero-beta-D-manno-heptose-7-phosphate kinase